eukprot:930427-Heterocapsa_arctica.AAC.1
MGSVSSEFAAKRCEMWLEQQAIARVQREGARAGAGFVLLCPGCSQESRLEPNGIQPIGSSQHVRKA